MTGRSMTKGKPFESRGRGIRLEKTREVGPAGRRAEETTTPGGLSEAGGNVTRATKVILLAAKADPGKKLHASHDRKKKF